MYSITMSKTAKLLAALRNNQKNVRLGDLERLVQAAGFIPRGGRGSHGVYTREGVVEIINLQDDGSGRAKPYQVKQVLGLIEKYNLEVG